jgi:hypothetical protein
MSEDRPSKPEKLEHRQATDFRTVFAEGCIVAAPRGGDECFNFVFFVDTFNIEHERMVPTGEEGKFSLQLDSDGVRAIREEQMRIIMTKRGARTVYEKLKEAFK